MFWGAFDVSYSTPEYTGASIVSGGASAAAGSGVGVRRAVLVFTRTPPGAFTDDVAECHFDFLNITSGVPDDTWTTADFTTLEGLLSTWFTGFYGMVSTLHTFSEVRWYRVGTGVVGANPAVRVTPNLTAGTSSASMLSPQTAVSITMKTARRKQWGRTYLPGFTTASLGADGVISTTAVNQVAVATDGLITAAQGSDFYGGVLSDVAGSFFATEQVQVDNLYDVIRRRRWRNATYKKILP